MPMETPDYGPITCRGTDNTNAPCPAGQVVSRRQALRIGLASAAVLVVAACTTTRGSDNKALDKAYRHLGDALDDIAQDDAQQTQLASIARRIENRCTELTQEHDEFRARFNLLSRQRETRPSQFETLIDGFTTRRTWQRDELFRLQDELRRELTSDEWAQVASALGVTQDAYARPSIGGA